MLTSTPLTLVLGATGKTGSRVANRLLTGAAPASFADFARCTAAVWALGEAR